MATEKTTKKPAVKKAPKASTEEFAVIFTGGKQYIVAVGDSIKIEKLSDDAKEGDAIVFDKVLLVDNGSDATIGTPYIKGAAVNATIERIARYATVDVVHYKQKSRYYKKYGHRQHYFQVKVTGIK